MIATDTSTLFAPIAQCAELRSAPVGDLVVAECRASGGARLAWHAHQHASVMLLLDGSFTEQFRARSISCTSSTALFKPAGERHANEYGHTGARFLIVELPPPQLAQLRERGALVDGIRTVQGPRTIDLGFRLRRELRHVDCYSTLSIGGLIYELLAVMSRESNWQPGAAAPYWLRRVHDQLRDNFSHRLNIADLASQVDVHPDHLSRCFRRQYGMLIGEYVRRLRIEWAAKKLVTTDMSLAELAMVTGFADQSEFTRRFRQQLGTTPGRYRSLLRH